MKLSLLLALSYLLAAKISCSAEMSRKKGGRKFESQFGHITFVDINHEIISTVILTLDLELDWYAAGPFSVDATERAGNNSTPNVGRLFWSCQLSARTALSSTWFKSTTVLWEERVPLQFWVALHLLWIVNCLSIILLVTQSLFCLDLLRRFSRTVKKSCDCRADS